MILQKFAEYILIEANEFYRGHPKNANPMTPNNRGLIWITQDMDLAKKYATPSGKVSKVTFSLVGKTVADIGDLDKTGSLKKFLAKNPPKDKKTQKLYDDAMYVFGGGTKVLPFPKFLHKIGSEKVIAYFKGLGVDVLKGTEDGGVVTYAIIK